MRILTLCAVMSIFWIISATPGEAATITVIRGDQVEKVSTARKSRMPHVLLGTPAPANDNEDDTLRETRVSGVKIIGAGGDTLWLHDTETGNVIACYVVGSGMVGSDTFRCTGQ
jgi:hypothetical protein